MKTNVIFLFVAFFLLTGTISAQTPKLGHINSQEVLAVMPERDSVEQKYREEVAGVREFLEELEVKLNNEKENFKTKNYSTETARQMAEQDIRAMEQNVQKRNMEAQQQLQQKQQQLMEPMLLKAQNAIDKVGRANGFTYIFDLSLGAILFKADNSIDITDWVLEEMYKDEPDKLKMAKQKLETIRKEMEQQGTGLDTQ